jgi:hypothetical protein
LAEDSISPVKLLIAYSVRPAREEAYYRFMSGEFLPGAQGIGLVMVEAWQTAWGDYPDRLMGMIADNPEVLEQILGSQDWREMKHKLAEYVKDYREQVVPYRNGFQFLKRV